MHPAKTVTTLHCNAGETPLGCWTDQHSGQTRHRRPKNVHACMNPCCLLYSLHLQPERHIQMRAVDTVTSEEARQQAKHQKQGLPLQTEHTCRHTLLRPSRLGICAGRLGPCRVGKGEGPDEVSKEGCGRSGLQVQQDQALLSKFMSSGPAFQQAILVQTSSLASSKPKPCRAFFT